MKKLSPGFQFFYQPCITSMGDLGGFEPKLDLGQVGDAPELLMPFLPQTAEYFSRRLHHQLHHCCARHKNFRWQCHNLKRVNVAVLGSKLWILWLISILHLSMSQIDANNHPPHLGFHPHRWKMLWLLWFSQSPGFSPLSASPPVTFFSLPHCTQLKAGGLLSIRMVVRAPVKIVPALWGTCLQEGHKSKIAPVTFPPVVNNHFVDLGHDSPTQPKSSSSRFSLQSKDSPSF